MSIDLAPTMLDDRRREEARRRCRARSSSATRPRRRGSTSSALATAATRRSSASARCAPTATATSTTSRPSGPSCRPNDYKERPYPVWNLLKELDAAGKLTPLQKFLTAPTMPAEELYDVVADPHETKNLADSPEHQAVLDGAARRCSSAGSRNRTIRAAARAARARRRQGRDQSRQRSQRRPAKAEAEGEETEGCKGRKT